MQDCLFEMINISKDILPSQLGDYIKRQITEKETLEGQIRNLKEEIQEIEKAKSDAEKNFALVKDKIGISSAELDWYANIKDSLEKKRDANRRFIFIMYNYIKNKKIPKQGFSYNLTKN